MQRPTKPSTIKDVARLAGVSVGTVSNIMNGRHHLHMPEVVQRTQEAARKLGYRPNSVARSLARGKTKTIGVCLYRNGDTFEGTFTRDTFPGEIIERSLVHASDLGYSLKIVMLPLSDIGDRLAQFDDSSVDGVLLISPVIGSPVFTWAKTASLPVVIAGELPPESDLVGVDVDDMPATRALVQSLIDNGHRHIGLIAGNKTHLSAHRREEAYVETLLAAGILPKPEWRYPGDYWVKSGREGALELLKRDPSLTAIVCANDWTAYGAVEALRQIGLNVPQDISVVGFDDVDIARLMSPALTTVRQPMPDIASTVMTMLVDMIEGKPIATPHTYFPATVVERATVGPVRESALVSIS